MLDKADEDSQFDVVYGLQKFKTVCPDFELSKVRLLCKLPSVCLWNPFQQKQLMQLDQLAKDYISYGEKSKWSETVSFCQGLKQGEHMYLFISIVFNLC